MSESRREFLKFVVAGSVAAGCPWDLRLLAEPGRQEPQVDGERFEICHQLRDGKVFSRPPVSKLYDVAIIGGGASGLAAAYFLRDKNFVLLEKEDHWGGNAYLEEYQGQAFATGSAFDLKGSSSDHLAREIGLQPLPIDSPDPTIVAGKWIPDTWREGLNELPHPPAVRDSFKKFRKEMLALDIRKNPAEFDSQALTKYLAGYAPEIRQWWDAFGPSNWGAKSKDTSALVALSEFQDFAGENTMDTRITLPGGNGALTKRLAEVLLAQHRDRMLGEATIVAVALQKDGVNVTFVHDGQMQTIAAKLVVMATPKLIASRVVDGIPVEQQDAMASFRYCPYPVINMIFDRPIYSRAYDTWCPGNSFTDFIVADWVMQSQPGYKQKKNILTFYTPLVELERKHLLTIEGCRQIALNVLRDFQKLLPEFNVDPGEIHFFRRGHPLFLSTPGLFTKVIPAASQPLERVFFANTDSIGPVSDIAGAVDAAHRAAEWADKRLAGTTPSAALVSQGLARG